MTQQAGTPASGTLPSRRVLAWLNQPRDIAALAVLRILIGGLMCFGALRFMHNGWIERLYLEPSFHFKYWGFEWVTVPGETGMYLLYAGIAISAFLVAIGAAYRIAIITFWCLFTYAELMDVTSYLNHYYFISMLTLIMCFLSPHRAWSVDAWLRPHLRANSLPAWQTYWLRFQVGLLYFYAGLAKFETDWLLHAQPLNIWLPPLSGMPLIGPLLEMTEIHFLFSWFAFLFDTTIIAFMLWRLTRPYAFVVILVFHVLTHLFFNIGLFPFIMVFAVLVFFDADWPRRLLPSGRSLPPILPAPVTQRWTGLTATCATVALAFCLLQFVTPLRHWAYPGSVLWHEQGMRFSWRVMLREKSGSVEYRVVTNDGKQTFIPAHRYLTEDQYREMAGQPDMILQLAHHIRDEFNARGYGPTEVYATTLVSLNGRRSRPLIDASVDLAGIEDGLGRATWITPAPQDPPPLQSPLKLVVHK
ncbi:MAG: HTTM domain-containing protein [Pseudomonadota bacterium]